ncbi:MAG: hypothetical protein L6Q54_12705 [Leptospiraceae bacterium]|nr:hypothetical protein [Leptospiraceae bacterium]MCK6382094.1 hypothetical protein [Leptospiraceae bacterium]NUM41699.1 hypothetical protein [Leptospiraceae bacterium]
MEQNNIENDEVSLVDIAKTLVIRRFWFLGFFMFAFLLTLVFAFIKYQKVKEMQNAPAEYVRYTTYLSVGLVNSTGNLLIEPLKSIEIELNEVYTKELNNKFSINIVHDWEKMGNLMKIVTQIPLSEDNKTISLEIEKYHRIVLQPIIDRHNRFYNDIAEKNARQGVNSTHVSRTEIVSLAQKATLQSDSLSKLTPTNILIFGFCVSILIGLVGVFFLEFTVQVKKSLKGH